MRGQRGNRFRLEHGAFGKQSLEQRRAAGALASAVGSATRPASVSASARAAPRVRVDDVPAGGVASAKARPSGAW